MHDLVLLAMSSMLLNQQLTLYIKEGIFKQKHKQNKVFVGPLAKML